MEILKYIPKNLLSRTVGGLVSIEHPTWLAEKARDWFVKRYKINMDEAEFPLQSYPSIGKLFVRRLKSGVRPIGKGLIHPCDSVLTQAEIIEGETLIQAKGKTYKLSDFVCDAKALDKFAGGVALTYYLCPTDYHRVHVPIDSEVTSAIYVPGALWPVNEWSVSNIDHLFAVNERVIFNLRSPVGEVSLVMVGATNVGKITASFDKDLVTNQSSGVAPTGWIEHGTGYFKREYKPAHAVKKGEEIGVFNMGSTVVMLYSKSILNVVPKLGPTRLGESVS